ncbi:DUF4189 domain-containing protein [Rhodanobacter sp. DHB23]|uniref:DUF4189 domain-containing protein n=1 Tax=Rhodanobacter sp. DHB23 TaxID=2775923 RepID=UPI00178049B4|nr:DUF4189 domain-containing protein [Rhodanobacter sp. DHB23]MBD8873462.1 DUF4189 domain-containing protein [Rhodanobacter sp. DHB23]
MKTLCFLTLLLVATSTHSQDCAGVNAGGVCVPPDVAMPGYQQQAPQPPPQKWVDHWGAIATYEPNGSLGAATNMPSQNSAEQAALADCQSKHGSACKIQLSYRNQCAAMVVSGKGYNVTPAATVDLAVAKGMNTCTNSGDPNCHVYYTACSLPTRIQ